MATKTAVRNAATDRAPLRHPVHTEKLPQDRAVGYTPDGRPVWRRNTGKDNLYETISRLAPDGQTYEWKTHTIAGMPNTTGMAAYEQNAWEPVQHKDHPGLFAPVGTEGPIIVGSSILMRRPSIITEEVREEDRRAALDQVRQARAQHRLDGAQADAVQHPNAQRSTFIRDSVTSDTGPRPQYEIE